MFKEHYRITLSTFETLVNILLGTELYRRCDESELVRPVWKQIAVVLWRFSNTHFGYRMAKNKFGCSHGSYNNFTDQFILAMSSIVIDNSITWPNMVEQTLEITTGCRSKNQETVPLTTEQKLYNTVQSRTQQKIENTFSLLVLRWKFLYKHLYLKNVGRLTQAIMLCCVLHNLCLDVDDMWELEENEENNILGNFQDSGNEDGAVFGLEEIENTNPIISERVLNALLAQLKTGGEQQQLAVMNFF
ncbi:hypothetical protein PHYBLDRAFT_173357 [Phycomyces blakesleeanus NRRL 1555(-)]|uniref:DDE Tnp4 domain-containing protein n=1 Tax=Phycomyces blakesleeanus (strain ATCC 8743b / DSM 1359 / FGSC 10004 / NBRC 33097 / NRRL 1555) TaxID=763407 RepID=A0A167KLD9_PHYB8|nr:hypothetical protein PHYBLDRAFT_173357 [Phycomyces blakesleeanus NRRL 1555(-)]OAD68359.1 hypothetical protein PHYBLDRAFT_173357 [Phycomyces blakesleeanus NRRL 1555(-)]|eukprot:XP_018286399.1 hypothetical protein PHYBLDRAFT_173357 [Phycomyces blakesleeanus NRRL 1555(-)]